MKGTTIMQQSPKPLRLLGYPLTLELTALLSIYFVQGILGLVRLAISFFLKDDLGLSPAEVAALTGISALPWVIKPLFGLVSDSFPLLGYRRRSYLVLSGVMGSAAWILLATVVDRPWQATLAILLTSLSVAVSDVIADSLIVERARRESLGRSGALQSLSWGSSALGGLLTAYLSGWLLAHTNARTVFAIAAIFPLLVAFTAWLIAEQPLGAIASPTALGEDLGHSLKNQMGKLWGALRQKAILFPTLFVFLWQATPSADAAFFFFSTNELGFEAEFLGRVRFVTSIATLVGIGIYQRFLKTIPFRQMLGWSVVLSAALGMTSLLLVTHANRDLGLDDRLFSLGDSLILTVMGQIAFMPVLVLSARLCPPGIEATFFALLMSIWNLAGLASQELGAILTHGLGVTDTDFQNLWLLVLLTNLSTLLPLPLLQWLPEGDPQGHTTEPLPPAEVFERRTLGSPTDGGFLPEVLPEWAQSSQGKSEP